MKRIAGIVLYNPEVERLKENIAAIMPQVDELLLVENGSHDTLFLNQFEGMEKVVIIRNNASKGIAYALNQILDYAYFHGYEWALTLDQDSVASDSLLDVYEKYTKPEVGVLGCKIVDRNFEIDESWVDGRSSVEVEWIITSASYTNTNAWKQIGGFDTKMFIDWVDVDYCLHLRVCGYKVLRIYETQILHELGEHTRFRKIFGRAIVVANRPAFRHFYSFRNLVYLSRKYPQFYSSKSVILQLAVSACGVVVYEKHKIQNISAIIRGIVNGLFMQIEQ